MQDVAREPFDHSQRFSSLLSSLCLFCFVSTRGPWLRKEHSFFGLVDEGIESVETEQTRKRGFQRYKGCLFVEWRQWKLKKGAGSGRKCWDFPNDRHDDNFNSTNSASWETIPRSYKLSSMIYGTLLITEHSSCYSTILPLKTGNPLWWQ